MKHDELRVYKSEILHAAEMHGSIHHERLMQMVLGFPNGTSIPLSMLSPQQLELLRELNLIDDVHIVAPATAPLESVQQSVPIKKVRWAYQNAQPDERSRLLEILTGSRSEDVPLVLLTDAQTELLRTFGLIEST